MPETPSAKPRRRFFRYSLRGLMLLIVGLSVAIGWIVHEAGKQDIAVAALEKLGCRIGYGWYAPDQSPTVLETVRTMTRAHAVSDEFERGEVYEVTGKNSRLTDASLTHLRDLPSLTHLNLDGTKITDAGLVNLRSLRQLKLLDLDGTPVTDAGLSHLQKLISLDHLYLGTTKVTDAGLAQLHELRELETLLLNGTSVTDVGLDRLHCLTKLTYLNLIGTHVTDAGVQELQKALPKCRIER